MPTPAYALMMARYNFWQNESLAKAASEISGSERQKDHGAFFGSIEKTFSYILWSGRLWLSRFEGTDGPSGNIASSVSLIANWDRFREERAALDRHIHEWAHGVSAEWLEGDLTWFAGSIGREKPIPRRCSSFRCSIIKPIIVGKSMRC